MGCEATVHANHHFMQLSDKWNILLTLDIKLLLTAFTVMLSYKWLPYTSQKSTFFIGLLLFENMLFPPTFCLDSAIGVHHKKLFGPNFFALLLLRSNLI